MLAAIFGGRSVKARVMSVIEGRIQAAETEFKQGCEQIDERVDSEIERIELKRDEDKDALLDQHVNTILGKVL